MCVMPEKQTYRLLRAGVFTLVCASVSAHCYMVSSGDDVPLGGLLLGMVIVFAMAWAASNQCHSWAMITVWMLWGQLILHVAFSYNAPLGIGHTGEAVLQSAPPTWLMLGAHTLALVSAWWLYRGERFLFAFLRFMALAVFALVFALEALSSTRGPINLGPPRVPQVTERRLSCFRYTRILRGPPVLSTV
jgi:hypothetical protein